MKISLRRPGAEDKGLNEIEGFFIEPSNLNSVKTIPALSPPISKSLSKGTGSSNLFNKVAGAIVPCIWSLSFFLLIHPSSDIAIASPTASIFSRFIILPKLFIFAKPLSKYIPFSSSKFKSPVKLKVEINRTKMGALVTLNFEISIIDPRGYFASKKRFSNIDVINKWPDEAFSKIKTDEATAFNSQVKPFEAIPKLNLAATKIPTIDAQSPENI